MSATTALSDKDTGVMFKQKDCGLTLEQALSQLYIKTPPVIETVNSCEAPTWTITLHESPSSETLGSAYRVMIPSIQVTALWPDGATATWPLSEFVSLVCRKNGHPDISADPDQTRMKALQRCLLADLGPPTATPKSVGVSTEKMTAIFKEYVLPKAGVGAD